MRKIFILIIAISAISLSSVNAQMVWGGRVGFCWTNLTGESWYNGWGEEIIWEGYPSIEGGVVLYKSLPGNFYINSGVMLSLRRTSYSAYDWSNWIDYTMDLSMLYLEVPFYTGFAIPIGNKAKPYFQTGPWVGVKLTETWISSDDFGEEEMDWEHFNKLNIGWGIAGGINFHRFKVELGYQLGLININIDPDWTTKTSSLFLGVSYIF